MVVQMIGQLVVNQLTGKLGTSFRDELLKTGFLRLPRSAHQLYSPSEKRKDPTALLCSPRLMAKGSRKKFVNKENCI